MLYNLDFANDTVLSRFFLYFLISVLNFLVPAIITQFFSRTAEVVITPGIPN